MGKKWCFGVKISHSEDLFGFGVLTVGKKVLTMTNLF